MFIESGSSRMRVPHPGQSLSRGQFMRLAARLQFALADLAGMAGGFALAVSLSGHPDVVGFAGNELRYFLAIAALYLAVAANNGAYAPEASIGRALSSLVLPVYFAGLASLQLGVPGGLVGLLLLRIAPTMALGLLGVRAFHAFRRQRLRARGAAAEPCVVVLKDGVDYDPPAGALVHDVAAYGLADMASHPERLDRLGRLIGGADRVIVACPPARRGLWSSALKGANVDGEILTEELAELRPIGAGHYHGLATIKVSTGPLGLRDRVLKRLFDIVVASLALLFLLPLMLLVAIAIKIDSPGPVLFRQKRIGRGNRQFYMHKFRSMRVERLDADAARLTSRNDDRVTAVGRFIRASSIDELPQLFDVLRGEMSIVGPRPHALGARAGDTLYWDVDPDYWHRHAVKPGMTGLAQVRGFRGTTFDHADLINRLQADLEYISRWSFLRDMAISFSTLKVLCGGKAF